MNAVSNRKHKSKPHFGIVLISCFYFLVALGVIMLFAYTYVTTSVPFVQRIFGIMLGCVLGLCIFYIGFGIWKGHTWAQIVVIFVSGGIVLFSIIAYIIGRVVTVGSAIYLIAMLVINILIIQYLFSRRAKDHFYKDINLKDAISNVIKKHNEERSTDNQK